MSDNEVASTDDVASWRMVLWVLNIAWRVLLVFVGIPVVWILRATDTIHMSVWHAIGTSVVLFLIAIGEYVLASM